MTQRRWRYHNVAIADSTADLLVDTLDRLKRIQPETPLAPLPRLTKSTVIGIALTMLIECLELEDGYVLSKAIVRFQESK